MCVSADGGDDGEEKREEGGKDRLTMNAIINELTIEGKGTD